MFALVFVISDLHHVENNSFTKKETLYNLFSSNNDNQAVSESRKYRRHINNELLKNQNNKSLFNVDRRCRWGARFSWISSLERPRGSGGIIATETRIGRDESEIAVVKDSFREQIVASIFIMLFGVSTWLLATDLWRSSSSMYQLSFKDMSFCCLVDVLE